jgi:hypothetical protein
MSNVKKSIMLISMITLFCSLLTAQSYQDIKTAKYLQLPTEKPLYTSAAVYMQADQSETRDALSFGLGKISGKKEGDDTNILDDLVAKVFADQVEKYATWNLFDADVSLAEGDKALKVVVVYTPDESGRPMGTPMKNNKGEHTFPYRVSAKMKVFDANDNLIIERDFGKITGTGHSKTWPAAAKSGGDMFSVKVSEEDEPSEKHPYEIACVDGALEHAKRVVYGLYGAKIFETSQGVYIIKSQKKESKNFQKLYTEAVENHKKILLTDSEAAKMQQCVDYWESILPKVDADEKWAVHYNLAVGYAWLLNDAKSIENISQVRELKKDRFDCVINKSGNFSKKDIDALEAYNTAEPFATYYAKGINTYPNIPKLLDLDSYTIAHVMANNAIIARQLTLPVNLPIYPADPKSVDMKKCEGQVTKNGEVLADFTYSLNKGALEGIEFKADKESPLGKFKATRGIQDKADLHPAEPRRVHYVMQNTTVGGNYGMTKDMEFFLNDYKFKDHNIVAPFQLDGATNVATELQTGYLKSTFTDAHFVDTMKEKYSKWYTCEFSLEDTINIGVNPEDTEIVTKAKNIDKNGMPGQYEITYTMQDVDISLHVKVKYKFGEQTTTEQRRKDAARRKVKPGVMKTLADAAAANGAVIKPTDDPVSGTVTMTKTYDCTYKIDDKGNWTEITVGDYTVTRSIKY